MKIFLSHSSIQKPFVKAVRTDFPSWLSNWLDEDDLLVGESFENALQRAIFEECDFLIVFISCEAADSDWVKKEVAWARERQQSLSRTYLLPVLLNCPFELLDSFGLKDTKAVIAKNDDLNSAGEVAAQLTHHISAHNAKIVSEIRYYNNHNEKLKQYFLAIYVALIVVAAAGGSKIVRLDLLITSIPVFQNLLIGVPSNYLEFIPSAGVAVISFALIPLILNCVNQLYGSESAEDFIIPGFVALCLGTLLLLVFASINVNPKILPHYFGNDGKKFFEAYSEILKPSFRMFIAGLIAYVAGVICNIWVFNRMREKTSDGNRGLRNIAATILSQMVDTLIFVPLAFYDDFLFFNGYSLADLPKIIIGQFTLKVLIAFASNPIFIIITRILKDKKIHYPTS